MFLYPKGCDLKALTTEPGSPRLKSQTASNTLNQMLRLLRFHRGTLTLIC